MVQIVSVVGSLLILLAYTGNQTGRLRAEQVSYSLINAVGAGILAVVALLEEQWGFLLLEGVWTIVSLAALVRAWR
jgi:hypothetical protein